MQIYKHCVYVRRERVFQLFFQSIKHFVVIAYKASVVIIDTKMPQQSTKCHVRMTAGKKDRGTKTNALHLGLKIGLKNAFYRTL